MRLGEAIEADEAEDLVEQLLACSDDPLAFVNLAFPDITLEKWQRAVLEKIGNRLQENARLGRFKPIQIAVASGNTVGKTALLSFIILWSLATFENTLGVVTAGTEPQIRTRLWGELSKWFVQLPDDLRSQFELTATAIFNRQNERTWRIDGRPWSERNQEAFSGLHNYGKRVLVIFDECSMIAEPIWRACDGMLNDAETEIIWCVFGNPLRLDGRFPMCFPGGRFAGLWEWFRVDSRKVRIANQESLAEKIAYYGEDSNYVRSHIKGEFPFATAETLIATDVVEMAAARESWVDPRAAVIIGADVASGHGEDSSCIVVRCGLDARAHPIRRYPGLDPIQFSYRIATVAREAGADAVFIDATGVGEGCVGKLRELGVPGVHAIYFGGKSDNPGSVQCANKRAELWTSMARWLKEGGAIPDDAQLKAELTGPEFYENPHGLVIERKADMRARGLASPDSADALALTFSYPVFTQMMDGLVGPGDHLVAREYNPFGDREMRGESPLPEAGRRYTAPGWPRMKSPEWGDIDNPADSVTPDAPPGEWQ